MLINTESNIVMFQFEPVKWQYSADRGRSKKNKDREEEKEDNGFTEALSKTSVQAYSPRDSPSSKQTVAPESLLGKPPKSRVLGKAAKLTSGKAAELHAMPLMTKGGGEGAPGLLRGGIF